MTRVILAILICQCLSPTLLTHPNNDNESTGDGGNDKIEGLTITDATVGSVMKVDDAENLGSLLEQSNGSAAYILSDNDDDYDDDDDDDDDEDNKINPSSVGPVVSLLSGEIAPNVDNPQHQKRLSHKNEHNMANTLSTVSGFSGSLRHKDGEKDSGLGGSGVPMFVQKMSLHDQKNQGQRRTTESNPTGSNQLNTEGAFGMPPRLQGNQNAAENLQLMMMLNMLSLMSNKEADKKAGEHKDHVSSNLSFLENARFYWYMLTNSELSNTIWEKSGLKEATKSFTGPDGRVNFELLLTRIIQAW